MKKIITLISVLSLILLTSCGKVENNTEDTMVEETTVEDTMVEETTVEETTVEDAMVEETTVEDANMPK